MFLQRLTFFVKKKQKQSLTRQAKNIRLTFFQFQFSVFSDHVDPSLLILLLFIFVAKEQILMESKINFGLFPKGWSPCRIREERYDTHTKSRLIYAGSVNRNTVLAFEIELTVSMWEVITYSRFFVFTKQFQQTISYGPIFLSKHCNL